LEFHGVIVALVTVRLAWVYVLAENNTLFSGLLVQNLLVFGSLLVTVRETWVKSLIFANLCFVVFGGLMCAFARDVVCSKLASEREAQAFVAHAIKQHFSAVGTTVDHCIETKRRRQDTFALMQILRDCLVGHDRCHALGLANQVRET
jgi:hypothetical protein